MGVQVTAPEKMAKLEVTWWRAHHKKDWVGLLTTKAEQIELQYGISAAKARKIAKFFVLAAQAHDSAEKDTFAKDNEISSTFWKVTEKFLVEYFKRLGKLQQ